LEPDDPDAETALALLRRWDGHLTADSAGGAVAEVVTARLAEIILEPHLGRELLDRFLGGGTLGPLAPTNELLGYWPWTLLRLLEDDSSGWLPGRFGKEAILTRALAETTRTLRRRLGSDPRQWSWGRLQQIHFRHLLDQETSVGRVLGQGPLPAGGSPHTVQQIATPSAGGSTVGASYRQLFDLADWDAARAVIAPGQSGHLASPHYADLLAKWRQGESIPLGWRRERIEAEARYRLQLTPASAPAG
jgi:penicillin amidase